jgi:hypothetical protein
MFEDTLLLGINNAGGILPFLSYHQILYLFVLLQANMDEVKIQ